MLIFKHIKKKIKLTSVENFVKLEIDAQLRNVSGILVEFIVYLSIK